MEVEHHVSTVLHILVGHQNEIGWWLVLIYMQTPPTPYHLESSGQATYMKTSPIVRAQKKCQEAVPRQFETMFCGHGSSNLV